MSPTVSREAAITTAVVAVAGSAVVLGWVAASRGRAFTRSSFTNHGSWSPRPLRRYLYREKTQEVARSTYAAVTAQVRGASDM